MLLREGVGGWSGYCDLFQVEFTSHNAASENVREIMHLSLCLLVEGITLNIYFYYINTNEIPSELLPENMISSHVKRSLLLWLHMKIAPFDVFREIIWYFNSLVFM